MPVCLRNRRTASSGEYDLCRPIQTAVPLPAIDIMTKFPYTRAHSPAPRSGDRRPLKR
jgi:hypothetical protein